MIEKEMREQGWTWGSLERSIAMIEKEMKEQGWTWGVLRGIAMIEQEMTERGCRRIHVTWIRNDNQRRKQKRNNSKDIKGIAMIEEGDRRNRGGLGES